MKTKHQDTEKHGSKSFLSKFKLLINSFLKNEYKESPIPVKMSGFINILNGSHRVGCMLYFNKSVCINTDLNSNMFICRPEYFTNRELYKNRMPLPGKNTINSIGQEYLDFSILEFIKLKRTNTRIVCFFSDNYNLHQNKINEIISPLVNILYKKKITLSKNGMKNIIREAYLSETFVNVDWKTNACFGNLEECNINIFVIESDNIDILNKFSASGGEYKKQLRDIFQNHHSVHITDNALDTLRMAKVFFNENTLTFYNKLDHNYSDTIKNKLNKFRANLITKTDLDNYCICSSFVLGLYNLREPQDLDYIHNETEFTTDTSHNKYEELYPSIKDIIYKPENYFYFNGLKCCTLDVVKHMKIKRNETPKDINDISLINTILSQVNIHLNNKVFNISLFQNYHKQSLQIINEPFPHIVIKNALPDHVYTRLYDEFPRIEYFNEGGMEFSNNYPIFRNCNEIKNDYRVSELWKAFISYQSSPEFFEEFINIFGDHVQKYYNFSSDELSYDLCERRGEEDKNNNKQTTWTMDSQVRINTPVIEKSSIIAAHCDNPFKLYVGLFYMPINGDNAGGDLNLYKIKDEFKNQSNLDNRRFFPEEKIEIQKTVKYEPNTFILFLNTDKSIHGVEPRNPTFNIRRLCTFSASYKNKKLFEMYDKKED